MDIFEWQLGSNLWAWVKGDLPSWGAFILAVVALMWVWYARPRPKVRLEKQAWKVSLNGQMIEGTVYIDTPWAYFAIASLSATVHQGSNIVFLRLSEPATLPTDAQSGGWYGPCRFLLPNNLTGLMPLHVRISVELTDKTKASKQFVLHKPDV